MKTALRRTARASALLLVLFGLGLATAPAANAAAVPAAPEELELVAGADLSITVEWEAVPGATSYNIYRGTSSGGEGATPIGSTTELEYEDEGLSPTPIYFYQVTAVNASGESPRSPEDASKTPPPIPTGGDVPGVTVGNSKVYYCKDAVFGGFDWFQTLSGWFPSVLGSSGSESPGDRVADMAYADEGTMTFNNVVVPTAGLYTLAWRYAFQGGLFPGVNNRQMGLKVNGTVITSTQSFPITGSFDVYDLSALQVRLNAGVNSVQQFAVSDHGLSRVDQLIVTPATASSPSGPTNLRVTPGNAGATLTWNASTSGAPTSYRIYRGTKSDGEVNTPVGTVGGTTTTFTDTGLQNNKQYFYFVSAANAVGGSPNSNEVSVIPTATGGIPAAPGGVAAVGGNNSVRLTWNAVAGATGYSVFRGTAPGGEAATPVVTSATNSFTDGTAVNGTTYYYKVAATNAAGTSPSSAEVSATPSGGGGAVLLSQGQPATASSVENAGLPATAAVDGNTATRWSSAFSDPQWLQVDLGATHSVSRIVLNWQTAYGKAFQLQTSANGTTWTTIYSTTTGAGGVQDLAVTGSGRYVRLYGTQRATQYGYSLLEFQVFGV
ncbi:fibronectin type 3 domain-containing protein [Allocatelliglobosispora scoriae]|uniref:Fibronectin type 3 domain-containing protein n=1 Tax=Allocatelliglobosispora scoriae TaxID=643052 RepID=A0A841BLL3_9ACTN|nr:discoidin domain-containing protein [Allocatelliglobosispora scoriae]MBB5867710.1 fibronectin type 3 domain-containing protein [Allocatelliglobosispora scoriae]